MSLTTAGKTMFLELEGITKRFDGIKALDNVDFYLQKGRIHALLGENGAGKSTLIKVLGGIYVPDSGRIRINGQEVNIRNVSDAHRYYIRIIHQELSLVPNLSVAENIYLGREPRQAGFLDRKKMYNRARELVTSLGLEEIKSVEKSVSDLSIAHQQLVEIARALSSRVRILVLDEPTSSLSEAETAALFATLARLRSKGVGIIYISHRLEEIIRLADKITVLRDGCSIGTQLKSNINQRQLVQWMVGRDIVDHFHRPVKKKGQTALEVRALCNPRVRDVTFDVRHGEVLGFAGLVGSGRTELAHAIFGIDSIDRGQIIVDGKAVKIKNPRDALEAGIVLVPEDRKAEALVMSQSLGFNLALPWVADWISGVIPNESKRRGIIERAVDNFNIKAASSEQIIDGLSGGNQQKAAVARWMEHRPKILILDEPTRGVDVGAREEMFLIISALVESGMAVLLISSDLNEVLNISHRIVLYHQGRIIETSHADKINSEEIMEKLTGAASSEN